jgi:hypothetical protein
MHPVRAAMVAIRAGEAAAGAMFAMAVMGVGVSAKHHSCLFLVAHIDRISI